MEALGKCAAALAVGFAGAGFVLPVVEMPERALDIRTAGWLAAAAIIHLIARTLLRAMRSED